MPVIVVPASLVQRLSSVTDAGETVLQSNHGIVAVNGAVVNEIGGTPLGFPLREAGGVLNPRCAFNHTFAGQSADALAAACPSAQVVAQVPADWRHPNDI